MSIVLKKILISFLLLKYAISLRQKRSVIQFQIISVLVSHNVIMDGKRKERRGCLILLFAWWS